MADESVEFNAPLFRSTLEKFVERVNAVLVPALETEALALLSAADASAPVESGELKASGFVDSGLTAHRNPVAAVGYTADYAAAEHEGFHGGRKGRGDFWLQNEANAFAPGFQSRIATAIRKAID